MLAACAGRQLARGPLVVQSDNATFEYFSLPGAGSAIPVEEPLSANLSQPENFSQVLFSKRVKSILNQ